MPYIKIKDRSVFNEIVKEMVSILTQGYDPELLKGEYLGFYLCRIACRFLNSPDVASHFFNSAHFSEGVRNKISSLAEKTARHLNGNNPLEAAGNYNYVVSAILWGVLGDSKGVDSVGYSFRSYLKSIVSQVQDKLGSIRITPADDKDRVMTSRRYTVAYGVMGDVVDEVYRRKFSEYEDNKIKENGDVWVAGELLG